MCSSLMGVLSTCVVSQFALVSRFVFIYGSVYLCCESVCLSRLHLSMGVVSTCVVSRFTFC